VRLFAAVSAATLILAGASPPTPRDLLRTVAAFTDSEWAAVDRGDAVSKLLETDTREVAVAGAVRISGDRERLIARFKDVESLKGHTVLDVGRFSAAPVPADLARVTFDDHSLDLRACRPGDCTVRLSAAEIACFHREVDWSGADWRNQSAAVWRSVEPRMGYPASYPKIAAQGGVHGSADWRRRARFRGGDDRRTDSISRVDR
jgi:hypothetical protein